MRSRCMNYDLVATALTVVREMKTDVDSPVSLPKLRESALEVSFDFNPIIILLNEYAI